MQKIPDDSGRTSPSIASGLFPKAQPFLKIKQIFKIHYQKITPSLSIEDRGVATLKSIRNDPRTVKWILTKIFLDNRQYFKVTTFRGMLEAS
jgi:hypothetical protein